MRDEQLKELDGRLLLPPICSSNGSCCFFYLNGARPDDESGPFAIKVYARGMTNLVEKCHQLQSLAAEMGLAPPVGRIMEVEDSDGYSVPAYETRVAHVKGTPGFDLQDFIKSQGGWPGSLHTDIDEDRKGPKYGMYLDLHACLKASNLCGDLHGDNIGWWKGNLVCIDFSHVRGSPGDLSRSRSSISGSSTDLCDCTECRKDRRLGTRNPPNPIFIPQRRVTNLLEDFQAFQGAFQKLMHGRSPAANATLLRRSHGLL